MARNRKNEKLDVRTRYSHDRYEWKPAERTMVPCNCCHGRVRPGYVCPACQNTGLVPAKVGR